MENQIFEMGDLVRVEGTQENGRITKTRSEEPKFLVQFGDDGTSIAWCKTEDLSLVEKAKKLNSGPGFYPGSSIMS